MGYTPLATSIRGTTDRSSRNGQTPRMVILHHAATTNLDQVVEMMQPGGRTVSAHAAVKDDKIVGTVDENYRAWSLSDAYFDSIAFTVECANQSVNGWTISAKSHESLARLTADWATRYNFPIIRSGPPKTWTLLGHKEVYTIWGGSYATACPGGMDLDWIAKRANQILNTRKKNTSMSVIFEKQNSNPKQYALAGDSPGTPANWLEFKSNSLYESLSATISTGVLAPSTWEDWKAMYLSPLATTGTGGGGGCDVSDLPTKGELGQALTSTVALVNEHADGNREQIIDAIENIPGGTSGGGSYSLNLNIDNIPGTATGTATPA